MEESERSEDEGEIEKTKKEVSRKGNQDSDEKIKNKIAIGIEGMVGGKSIVTITILYQIFLSYFCCNIFFKLTFLNF